MRIAWFRSRPRARNSRQSRWPSASDKTSVTLDGQQFGRDYGLGFTRSAGKCRIFDSPRLQAVADAEALQQCVGELLSNAVRYDLPRRWVKIATCEAPAGRAGSANPSAGSTASTSVRNDRAPARRPLYASRRAAAWTASLPIRSQGGLRASIAVEPGLQPGQLARRINSRAIPGRGQWPGPGCHGLPPARPCRRLGSGSPVRDGRGADPPSPRRSARHRCVAAAAWTLRSFR